MMVIKDLFFQIIVDVEEGFYRIPGGDVILAV